MNEVVALINCSSYCRLHSLTLEPRFSVWEVDMSMRSEEGEETSKLVILYEKIISCLTVKSWDVGTSEWMSSNSQLEKHIDRALYFRIHSTIVTSPEGSELLTSEEETSRKHEGSSLVIVSCQEASERTSLMKSTVSIVHITMFKAFTVSPPVNHIHGHSVRAGTKYWRFIHIVPERIQVVWAFEIFVVKLLSPEVLGIFIQEINVGRVAWPAVPVEGTIVWGSHKNACQVSFRWFRILIGHSIFVNEVIVTCFDVRVNNYSDSTVACFDFWVHRLDLVICKILVIELEVLKSVRTTLLLGPFNVHPQNINRESVSCKVSVPFHNHFCANISPLAEVETKHVKQRHRYEAGDCGKVFLNFFNPVTVACSCRWKGKKFQGTRFWNKIYILSAIHVLNTYVGVSCINPGNSSTVAFW